MILSRLLSPLILLIPIAAVGQEYERMEDYVRVVVAPGQQYDTYTLQSSVRSFSVGGGTVEIRLAAMVHGGNEEYFKTVAHLLRDSDLILMEGMDEEGQEKIRSKYPAGKELAESEDLAKEITGASDQDVLIDHLDPGRIKYVDDHMEELARELSSATGTVHERLLEIRDLKEALDGDDGREAAIQRIRLSMMVHLTRITRDSCCFPFIEDLEKRSRLQKIVHEKRDGALLRKLEKVMDAREHETAAIVFGAAHIHDLEPVVVKKYGARLVASCWVDVVTARLKIEKDSGPAEN